MSRSSLADLIVVLTVLSIGLIMLGMVFLSVGYSRLHPQLKLICVVDVGTTQIHTYPVRNLSECKR